MSRSTRRSVSSIVSRYSWSAMCCGASGKLRSASHRRYGCVHPRASRIAPALPELKRFQPMLRLTQSDRIFARPNEIAEGLIVGRRDVDRGELTGAMQSGQGIAVPPINLGPIPAPLRHARGIHDDAVFPLGCEIAMDPKPARAGLIHEPQSSIRRSQRPENLRDRLEVAADGPVVPDLAGSPSSATEISIDSLWTSISTNMLRFAMACLRCVWLCASPSSASRNPRVQREAGLLDSHTV